MQKMLVQSSGKHSQGHRGEQYRRTHVFADTVWDRNENCASYICQHPLFQILAGATWMEVDKEDRLAKRRIGRR